MLILLIFGYLIGSISPGFLFGRAKGIDIRKYGRGGTGATNTYRVVGPAYGIIAGVLDALKALFVYYIAVSGFKFLNFVSLSPDLSILVGLAAVAGHIFPFYLNFKGGRGAASLLGLNLIAVFYARSIWTLFLLVGSLIYSAIISEEREKVWTAPMGRTAAKLSALVLPITYVWFSKGLLVSAVLVLLSASLVFDIVRFLAPQINLWYLRSKKFAKQKELRRFSGYTLFLLSAFLLFNFFPAEIAVVSLVFFIVGDILAPAGQLRYMPHQRILGDKTLGGAFVIFLFSILAGLFLNSLTPLALPAGLIILGALFTSLLDQLSVFVDPVRSPMRSRIGRYLWYLASNGVDDNLLVPLGTAILLTLFTL